MATPASPITTVSSAADMVAGVPSNLFDGISDTPDVSTGDESVDTEEAPAETEPDTGDDIAEPADTTDDESTSEAPAGDATAETKPAEAAAVPEELPEGVTRGKDRKGKPGFFLEEGRYNTFHGNHKIVQQASELIGEPLTPEAIQLRHEAYLGQERLFNNLTSGDPAAQGDVVSYILREMKGAQQNGEVGVDPTIPFAESVYKALQAEAPDAYAHLRFQGARDLIGEMFDQAARVGDRDLFSSAQRLAVALAGVGPKPADVTDQQYAAYVRDVTGRAEIPFYTLPEMQGLAKPENELTQAQRKIADLESRLNGGSRNGTAEQYNTWFRENVKAVNASIVDDAVKPALASVEAGWQKFPDDYKRLVTDPLHREIVAAVKADPRLDQQVKDLQMRARRATSEQVRAQLGEQIKQLFVNRARQVAEAKAPPIIKFAADWLKGRSDNNHERRNNAQARTTPKGPGAPVKTSSVPADIGFKDGIYDPKVALKQMQALFR